LRSKYVLWRSAFDSLRKSLQKKGTDCVRHDTKIAAYAAAPAAGARKHVYDGLRRMSDPQPKPFLAAESYEA
jgi:hypothetical protein